MVENILSSHGEGLKTKDFRMEKRTCPIPDYGNFKRKKALESAFSLTGSGFEL
jgi:hypothetical protein